MASIHPALHSIKHRGSLDLTESTETKMLQACPSRHLLRLCQLSKKQVMSGLSPEPFLQGKASPAEGMFYTNAQT